MQWFFLWLVALAACVGTDSVGPATRSVQRSETVPEWAAGATLDAVRTTPTRVMLVWPAATGGVGAIQYRVYRDGSLVTTTPAGHHTDTGLTPSTAVAYAVRAVDGTAAETPIEGALTRAVTTAVASAAPTWGAGASLVVARKGKRRMELAWPAAEDDFDELRYEVSHRPPGGPEWTLDAAFDAFDGAPGRQIVASLAPATDYEFRVVARDQEGHGTLNHLVLTHVTLGADHPPWWDGAVALTASPLSSTSLRLAWPAASLETAHYRVWRVEGSTLTLLGEPTATALTVTGLTTAASYTFQVRAVDEDGLVSTNKLELTTVAAAPSAQRAQPPPDRSRAAPFRDRIAYLYAPPDGAPAIQTGVAAGAVTEARAAVVRGRVLRRTPTGRAPAVGVTVRVVDHAEFGETTTDADGWFALAVNGGGVVRVDITHPGHVPLQRRVDVPWNEYAFVEDSLLTPLAPAEVVNVSAEDGVAAGGAGVVGPVIGAGARARRGRVFLPAGTRVRACRAGTTAATCGDPLALTGDLGFRITEVTVGDDDEAAMQGELPASSAYTYAVSYDIDEASGPDVRRVEFVDAAGARRPVVGYVDNFLDLRTAAGVGAGYDVPVGWYDRASGAWVPAESAPGWSETGSGRAVRILSISGGLAAVDTDGDSTPDDDLGLSDDERAWLATQYASAALPHSLWRVPTLHFTAYDYNFGEEPTDENPGSPSSQPACPPRAGACSQAEGSVIECERRALGETMALPGTGLTLEYRSSRQAGWFDGMTIPVTVPTNGRLPSRRLPLADSSQRPNFVKLQIYIGDTRIEKTFGPSPDGRVPLDLRFAIPRCGEGVPPDECWDGLIGGVPASGAVPVQYRVGYGFASQYASTGRFGYRIGEIGGAETVPFEASPTRRAMIFWDSRRATLYTRDDLVRGFGGWSLHGHHVLDLAMGLVLRGDGSEFTFDTQSYQWTATRFVGRPVAPSVPPADDAVAVEVQGTIGAVRVRPDGTVVVAYADGRVFTVGEDAHLHALFDARGWSPAGDRDIRDLALGADGAVYLADRATHSVWRWQGGSGTRFAGTGAAAGLGPVAAGPADALPLDTPEGLAFGPDGSLYVSEYEGHRIRRIAPDGRMAIFAGTGANGCRGPEGSVLGAPAPGGAASTTVPLCHPRGVVVSREGVVYFAQDHRVEAVVDGRATDIAGTERASASCQPVPDGVRLNPAFEEGACIDAPAGLELTPTGDLLLVGGGSGGAFNSHHFVHRIDREGRFWYVAGTVEPGPFWPGNAGPAVRPASSPFLYRPRRVVYGPRGDLFVLSSVSGEVWRLSKPLGVNEVSLEARVPSPEGDAIYVFDRGGRHLHTVDPLTGRTVTSFDYDGAGRLQRITQPAGSAVDTTLIFRPDPRTIVVRAPRGEVATLTLDPGTGYLRAVSAPHFATQEVVHDALGMLGAFHDADGRWHRFAYNAAGQLTRDAWGASATADLPGGRVVTLTEEPWAWNDTADDHAAWRRITLTEGTLTRRHLLRATREGRQVRVQEDYNSAGPEMVSTTGEANGQRWAESWQGIPLPGAAYAGWTRTVLGGDPAFDGAVTVPTRLEERFGAARSVSRVRRSVYDPSVDGWSGRVTEPSLAVGIRVDTETVVPPWSAPDSYAVNPYESVAEVPAQGYDGANVALRHRTEWRRTSTALPWTVTSTSPLGRSSVTALDLEGRAVTATPPSIAQSPPVAQHATHFTYDSRGRLEQVTRGDRTVTYAYRATGGPGVEGRLQSVTVAGGGLSVTTSYDIVPATRTATTTLPGHSAGAPRQITSVADPGGNLVSFSPPGRPAYTSEHTWRGLVERAWTPAAMTPAEPAVERRERAVYDTAGRLVQVWRRGEDDADPALGVTFTHSGMRPLQMLLPLAPGATARADVTMGYHPRTGLPTSVTHSDADVGSVTTLYASSDYRDEGNNLLTDVGRLPVGERTVAGGVDRTLWWEWDCLGDAFRSCANTLLPRWRRLRYPAPASGQALVAWFDYEADGGVSRVAFRNAFVSRYGDPSATLTLERDATAGTLQAIALTEGADVVRTELRYDAYGELTSAVTARGSTTQLDLAYGYDGIGRLQRVTDAGGDDRRHAYDAAGRLSDVCAWSSGCAAETDAREHYEYDVNGNRTAARYRDGSGALLASVTAAYDAQDRLTSTTRTADGASETTTYDYDPQGRVATRTRGTETTTYDYDPFGRLKGVTRADVGGSETVTYGLDATGRRASRAVGGVVQRRWIYQGAVPAAELDAAGYVLRVFAYASRPNVPDAVFQREGGAWAAYRVVHDHLGSLRKVVRLSDGAVVQSMRYDAFGRAADEVIAGGWEPLPFGYAGGLYDRVTGLVRFGARDYDAEVGRWIERDPVGFAGGDTNVYAYVGGRPNESVDPSGLAPDASDLAAWVPGVNLAAAVMALRADGIFNMGSEATMDLGARQLCRANALMAPAMDSVGMFAQFAVGAAGMWAPRGGGFGAKGGGPSAGSTPTSPSAATNSQLGGRIAGRVDELRAAIPVNQQGRITMGAGLAEDVNGTQYVLIGTSEPRGYLRPGVTLNPGETLAPGLGHAEADIVAYAQQNGLRLLEVGATRPICPNCANVIVGAGALPVTPLRVP